MADLASLLETADLLERLDVPSTRHLTSPIALRDYVRIADETAGALAGGRLLDWGCGYGHLSHLLRARGLDVTSYDVGPALVDGRIPFTRGLRAVRGGHPDWLPFRSGAFDGVLACGVLEHVPDAARSLDELRRVLRPGGRLFVSHLPQRTSYKEFLIERLDLGYAHARRYSAAAATALLEAQGFRILRLRRSGMLPHLATGLPPRLRRRYYRLSSRLYPVDGVLSRVPGVNLLAESLEVVAEAVNP